MTILTTQLRPTPHPAPTRSTSTRAEATADPTPPSTSPVGVTPAGRPDAEAEVGSASGTATVGWTAPEDTSAAMRSARAHSGATGATTHWLTTTGASVATAGRIEPTRPPAAGATVTGAHPAVATSDPAPVVAPTSAGAPRGPARVAAVRLNHGALRVHDVGTSAAFYTRVLGLEVVARNGDATVLLRLPGSANHHDLALVKVDSPARMAPPGLPGLHHLAWEVASLDDLAAVRDTLIELQALERETDQGVAKSVHGIDPSGNPVEVLWQLPRPDWGALEHQAIARPMDLAEELARRPGIA